MTAKRPPFPAAATCLALALALGVSACGGGSDTPAEPAQRQDAAHALGEPAEASRAAESTTPAADEGLPDAQLKATAELQARARRLSAQPATTPCPGTGCVSSTGSLAQAGQRNYHPGQGGFDFAGGTLRAWLQGPSGTDFDLVLGRYNAGTGGWDRVSASEGTTSEESISMQAAAGRYRWRVAAYSGNGSSTLWTQAEPGTGTTDPGTPKTYGTCSLPDFTAAVLQRINRERANGANCGGTAYPPAPALAWNDLLAQAAGGHSQDMKDHNYFSHTGSDGSTMSQRVSATGYHWSALGENIAAGQRSVDSVFDSWMASAGHCKNIMNARYVHMGISCVSGGSGNTYPTYWTLDLGRPM